MASDEIFADEQPTAAYIAATPSEITGRMWRWRVAAIGRYTERWLEAFGESSSAKDTARFLQHAGELAKLRATGAQPERAFALYNEWGQTLWDFDEANCRRESIGREGAFAVHVSQMEEVFFSIESAEYDPADPPVMALLAAAVCARDT
jgi:hypothetical protein